MATQLLTEEDLVSFSDACSILQQVTSILRDLTRDPDLREFYTHVGACAVMISSFSGQNGDLIELDKDAVSDVFEQLGVIIRPDIRSYANQPNRQMSTGDKVRLFTRNWRLTCQQLDEGEDKRLLFIQSWLKFDRMTSGDRLKFVSTFSLCMRHTYSGLRRIHSFSSLSECDSQEPTVQPWTHATRVAAQSVFKALVAANCSCDEPHEITTRLRLGSNRKTNFDSSTQPSTELQFNFFLSNDIGDPKWHGVRVYTTVKTPTKVIQFDMDPPQATNGSPTMKRSNTHDSRLKRPPRRVISICKQLRQLPDLDAGLDLEVTKDGLVTLHLDKSDAPNIIDAAQSPVTLKAFLEDKSNLTNHHRSAKTARTLSILLSCAIHDLHNSSWILSTWDSSNILLFNTVSTDIAFWPFIQLPLSRLFEDLNDQNDIGHSHFDLNDVNPDDDDSDELNVHQCPILVLLARTLMEIFFWTSFEDMAERCGVELTEDSESSNFSKFMEAILVFDKLRGEFPEYVRFFSIVGSCFDTARWEDDFGSKLDDKTLQERIYDKIVRQLDAELVHAFSAISISEHDERFKKPKVEPSQPRQARQTPTLPISRFFDDEVLLEEHSVKLAKQKNYNNWKSRFQQVYKRFITDPLEPTGLAPYSLRIAILDTGIDLTHSDVKARKERIRRKYNWLSSAQVNDVTDRNGHGTFTACLLLDYAPHADLYVAKIAEGGCPAEPKTIAKAINHAVSKWNVDIISMSFGYPEDNIDGIEELEAALEEAKTNKVLLFAAASNSRGQRGLSYPASHSAVIEIHSTSTYGNPSPFTPRASRSRLDANLATVGEVVESAWPRSLSKATVQTGQSFVEYKSGTSYATPIAAGIAAFVLLYAWEHLPPSLACKLKIHRKMVQVLTKLSEKHDMDPAREEDYHFLDLGLESDCLFGRPKKVIDVTLEDWIERAKG